MLDDLAVKLKVLEWTEKARFPRNGFETNRHSKSVERNEFRVNSNLAGLQF